MSRDTDHAAAPRPWWKTSVVYQVYPRSFADGNADGVGDLIGLTHRLDHLSWLGVDALWLSPVFRSPMADFGYDVSDYCDIDPVFGDLAAMDALIEGCHERGIKVLLDWVPNHTSDQHPWFLDAASGRDSARRDWYIWRDEPPNNWLSAFDPAQTAWEWHEPTGQYYLRTFLREQPDLNWANPDVRAAMHDTLRFWLDRGVDGFRMDVIHLLGKDFADDPADAVAAGIPHVPYNDVAVTHEYLREIRAVLDEYDGDRTSVGEVYLFDPTAVARYYGRGDELHLSFNFGFTQTRWDAAALRKRIESALATHRPVDAWPTWVFSNHDIPRHRSRFGGDERVARSAAVLLLTLPGTPFLYAGEELGLLDAEIPDDRVVDPGGRDGCRAPLPWSDEPGHGWPSSAWLPLPPEADDRNVETQRRNLSSILHLYRHLLELRRATPALHEGDIEILDAPPGVLVYSREAIEERSGETDRWIVAINTTAETVTLDLPDGHQWVLRSEPDDIEQTDVLAPWAAAIAHVREERDNG